MLCADHFQKYMGISSAVISPFKKFTLVSSGPTADADCCFVHKSFPGSREEKQMPLIDLPFVGISYVKNGQKEENQTCALLYPRMKMARGWVHKGSGRSGNQQKDSRCQV